MHLIKNAGRAQASVTCDGTGLDKLTIWATAIWARWQRAIVADKTGSTVARAVIAVTIAWAFMCVTESV